MKHKLIDIIVHTHIVLFSYLLCTTLLGIGPLHAFHIYNPVYNNIALGVIFIVWMYYFYIGKVVIKPNVGIIVLILYLFILLFMQYKIDDFRKVLMTQVALLFFIDIILSVLLLFITYKLKRHAIQLIFIIIYSIIFFLVIVLKYVMDLNYEYLTIIQYLLSALALYLFFLFLSVFFANYIK